MKRWYVPNLFFCKDKLNQQVARVAELVDALDLGSSAFGCGGSTPPSRTMSE